MTRGKAAALRPLAEALVLVLDELGNEADLNPALQVLHRASVPEFVSWLDGKL